MEGSGHGLIQGPISAFAWRDWGKPLQTSISIAGLRAEIRSQNQYAGQRTIRLRRSARCSINCREYLQSNEQMYHIYKWWKSEQAKDVTSERSASPYAHPHCTHTHTHTPRALWRHHGPSWAECTHYSSSNLNPLKTVSVLRSPLTFKSYTSLSSHDWQT
jgi:hypothetical protein